MVTKRKILGLLFFSLILRFLVSDWYLLSFFGMGFQTEKEDKVLANFLLSYQVLIWLAASIDHFF